VLIYLDPSVLARAYLHDEPGHQEAAALLQGDDFLITSTLTLIEVSSALFRAARSNRIGDLEGVLLALDADISADGPVTMITADQLLAENAALEIVRAHGLRTLDAHHLAVADLSARPLAGDDEEVAFASRDDAQRAVAEQLGFATV
jgi:predicted nucleic acid-binding protein